MKIEGDFTQDELDGLQNDLSDFLCWVYGFNAGCQVGDASGYPFDVEMMRRLNLALKRQLHELQTTKP